MADSTTVVTLQPDPNLDKGTGLTVTGAGLATLTAQSSAASPFANVNITVGFTLTAAMAYDLTGSVTSTNSALPGTETASCLLTGPGVSAGFGKLSAAGPWVFTGDVHGVLAPGAYTFAVVLQTSSVSAPDSQSTGFSNLLFKVSAIAPLKSLKFAGLCTAAVSTTPRAATEGSGAVTITAKGAYSAKFQLGGDKLSVAGTIDANGRFFDRTGNLGILLKRKGKPNVTLTLSVNARHDQITGALIDAATIATSRIDFALVVYTSKAGPVAPFIAVPPGLIGSYTVIFQPTAPGGQVLTPAITIDGYPQGTGWATLTVDKKGVAKLKGVLADGSPVACAAPIAQDNRWPLFASLNGGAGSISGWVTFADLAAADLAGPAVRWFRPAGAPTGVYPAGWAGGVVTDLAGSKFTPPVSAGAITGIPATTGAATIRLSGAGVTPVAVTATIDLTSKVTIGGDNSQLALAVVLTAKAGTMTGSFVNAATSQKTAFSGVIVQKLAKAFGFFLSTPQSGAVLIQ